LSGCIDAVLYQMVQPFGPEAKGRWCLTGTRIWARVSVGGSTIGEAVGPLVVGGLNLDISDGIRWEITSNAL